jgi:membrane fusion protein, heavy metal efflux system
MVDLILKIHKMKNFHFLFVTIALFSGCTNSIQQDDHPSMESLAHTLYTDHLELFVEFKPFVVGQSSKFAAHFTELGEKFTALTDAEITVSLISNGKGIRQSIDSCSSPGIFRLALTPKHKGKGTLIFDVKTRKYTDRITIPNVTIYENENEAILAQVVESAGNDIRYLKEQAWKVEFANTPVQKKAFENVIKTSGEIQSAFGDEMIVVAKASGIVLFINSQTIEGTSVSGGQTIFIITGEDLAEDNVDVKFKEAKTNYNKSKVDFERAAGLITDKIISQKEFQSIKQRFEIAENHYNALARNYSSKGKNCLTPMSGFIKQVLVKEGQFVTVGTPLATLSKNKKLILQAQVSQKYFTQLASIHSANFKNSEGIVYSTSELNGAILSYGRSITFNSPFIPITFEIDNIGNIIPGSIVEIFLKSNPIPDALVIPVTSLVEEQGVFYVYVQTAGESFQKREVKLGANDGMEVQVLEGVSENERVVTLGGNQIKLATAAGALPVHGHEH